MAIKPYQTSDLNACLKDKDTVATKKDNYVELILKVEKKITKEEFDSAIEITEKAESIAADKTFLESEKEKYYPEEAEPIKE